MATFVFFDEFKGNLGLLRINLETDTFKEDKLVGYLDYGSGLTLPDGGVFTIKAGTAANGWFELDG